LDENPFTPLNLNLETQIEDIINIDAKLSQFKHKFNDKLDEQKNFLKNEM
jgi:hypothetical protein